MLSEAGEETRKTKKKARKPEKSAASTSASSKASKQQQEAEDRGQDPPATFTPYDYSQSDFKLFAGMMGFQIRVLL